MRTPFNKTGVHIYPYLLDMSPGDIEPVAIDPETTIEDVTASIISTDTGAAVTPSPSIDTIAGIAIVTVASPPTTGMYSLRVQFTGTGVSAGRVWSIILAIRVSDR